MTPAYAAFRSSSSALSRLASGDPAPARAAISATSSSTGTLPGCTSTSRSISARWSGGAPRS
jgi:hypothetical protein